MFRCFKTYRGAALLTAVTAIALYLIFWHGTHLAAAAPVLLLPACPLMNVFGHRGHSHLHHKNTRSSDSATDLSKVRDDH